jgi:AcrR family transcriptional regulator
MEAAVPAGQLATGSAAASDAGSERSLRADARRNRDALLAAGAAAFAERPDSSLEDIARRAGVGIGTLYRHFPDRDALTEAVYRREVERLCDGVGPLLAGHPADVALASWMRNFAAYVATKRGMMVSLKAALGTDSELFTYSQRRIREAIDALVSEAVTQGTIRGDVDADALLTGMRGICLAGDANLESARTGLLIDLLVDGLRYGAPTRR